ncbi:Release factor [Glarea lozoyensis ATCC 20868]|uniref:Release factor n=1 Tax=Glarea lozoyensis (strain ATCC 20868 / MF5171) TaxID=1116229 RepID=S3E8G7_GLAL2|nr:Release factor [Glarea lozoyensis ATCC 20868]EPE34613.1 Release factor [Glarea lozoyensis ATCC 20868]
MLERWSLILRRSAVREKKNTGHVFGRSLSATPAQWKKKMPDRPKPPPEKEFTEAFLHGSGPGGQKINKTSSAVQLIHATSGIVLKVQATRSRSQNRKIARQMLADRLDDLEKGDKSRSAVVGEVKKKKKSSAVKKSKRKYRKLDEAKASEEGAIGDGEVDGNDQGPETKP